MRARCHVVFGFLLAASLAALMPAFAGPGHTQIPSAVPSAATPAVNDGQVHGIVQTGTTMVVGGTFTSVTPPGGTATSRTKVFAFDALTGALRAFDPKPNSDVEEVLEGPTAGTVYVAGFFTTLNGVATSHLALLNATTGAPVAGFKAPATNGGIRTITKAGNRLLLGGNFSTAGGVAHKGLASINPTTGALDPFLDVNVADRHNDTGSGAQGAVGVRDLEATPDGTKVAVIGNFKHVDGLDRDQLVVLNLTGVDAAVDPSWRTQRYQPYCFNFAFDSYLRGVSVSPDGSFFVVAATGGQNFGTLCDAASRFDFSAKGQDIQPTWSDYSGGDTLWGVDITEKAVFVGGHQRWMNNSDGSDFAGQGAVPRPGLTGLDTDSGLPISWNPGRNPRGAGAYSVYASPTGLWVGSDTVFIGNRQYRRPRLAFFPLAGGAPQASETPPSLPGNVYLGGPPASALSTISFNGTTAAPAVAGDARGVDWNNVRGAFMLGNTLFYGRTDGALYKRTFTASTTGAATRIDPYHDPIWDGVATGSGNTYDGALPTLYGQISNITGMFYANDRIYYTLSGNTHLYWRWFNADSGIVGSKLFTADGGRSWSDTGGLFRNGSSLYIASRASGNLLKIAFTNSSPQGATSVVDASQDWRANALFIGPGELGPRAPSQ